MLTTKAPRLSRDTSLQASEKTYLRHLEFFLSF